MEGGDPINLSAVPMGCASLRGQLGGGASFSSCSPLGLLGCILLLPNPGTTGKPKSLGQLRAVHQITRGLWVLGRHQLGVCRDGLDALILSAERKRSGVEGGKNKVNGALWLRIKRHKSQEIKHLKLLQER